jgi:hypothetical protein
MTKLANGDGSVLYFAYGSMVRPPRDAVAGTHRSPHVRTPFYPHARMHAPTCHPQVNPVSKKRRGINPTYSSAARLDGYKLVWNAGPMGAARHAAWHAAGTHDRWMTARSPQGREGMNAWQAIAVGTRATPLVPVLQAWATSRKRRAPACTAWCIR